MPAAPATRPNPPGRRERRKHLTRRELLVAGRKLFGEQGLYDSRIEDLTRLAGVAKGTIYGYFASKQALMEAVVTAGFSEMLGTVTRAAHAAGNRDELFARMVAAHLEFFAANPDLVRVFHQVRGLLKFERPEARALRAVMLDYLDALAHLLSLHPRTGRGPLPDPLETATLLFGAVSGVQSMRSSLGRALRAMPSPETTTAAIVGLLRAHERAGAAPAAVRPGRARTRGWVARP